MLVPLCVSSLHMHGLRDSKYHQKHQVSSKTVTTKVRVYSWKCVCLLDFTQKEGFTGGSLEHKLSADNNNNVVM